MLARPPVFASFSATGSALCLALGLFSCSSSNFESAASPDAALEETGGPGEVGGSDAPVVPDPCAPEAGKAKYCIEVKLARPDHPPYNAASGAPSLGLDGKGKVFVALYDKPIGVGPGSTQVPKAVLTYPPDTEVGREVDVDKELPTTIVGSAPEGAYSVLSVFEDNLTSPRGAGNKGTLAGDFVAVPTVKDRALVYPKMNLTLGTTQRVTIELYPWRRISIDVSAGPTLLGVLPTNKSILGDGPMLLGLFDGPERIGGTTAWLTLDDAPCVDLNLQGIPTGKTVTFGTTIDGGHNIFLSLFDYTSSDPDFPGRGTLMSKSNGGPYPRIDISKDTWTASAAVTLNEVAFGPQPAGTTNALKCE